MHARHIPVFLILFSTLGFQLRAFSLDAPALLTPRHNEAGTNARPGFTWRPVKDAAAYEIEIAADYNFNTPVVPATRATGTAFTPAAPLYPAPRFWRVRAIDAKDNPGPWSPVFCYRLSAPPPAAPQKKRNQNAPVTSPGVVHPKHDQRGIIPNPSFTWEISPGAIAYEIEIAADYSFNTPVVPVTRVDTPRYVPLAPLYPANRFWRTRAIGPGGKPGPWSSSRTYRLHPPANTVNIPAGATLAQIRDAIASAPGDCAINFAPGATYRLNPADGIVLTLDGRDDIIIDGNGSTFVIENPAAGFAVLKDCRRIVIRRLTIDYDPLPHSIGTVVSVNPAASPDGVSTITLRRLPGYPAFDAPHMLVRWSMGVILDPQNPGRMKTGSPLVVNYTDSRQTRAAPNPAAPGLFDIPIPNANHAKFFAPGDRAIVFARDNTRGLFNTGASCADITYDRITVHAAPAGHFGALGSSDIKILSCRLVRKPGAPERLYAGNADGAHIRANLLGPWIEGCAFEALGDDAIALYNKGISILALTAPDTVTVAADFMDLQPGDRFVIFNPHTGQLAGNASGHEVSAVKPAGANARSITFTPALPSGAQLPAGDADWWKNAQLFNRTRCNAGFVVKDNTFTNIRRYSIIARSTDGAIRGNTITGSSNTAIALLNEPVRWGNGLHSERILITGNTIDDCAFDRSSENTGSITVNLRSLSGASARLHRNIRITNNKITSWNHHAILLRGAARCEVTGNTIGAPVSGGAPILTENTEDCIVRNNALP